MEPKVLIIEDNEENLQLMVYILKHFKLNCLTARDGEAGLKIAQSEPFDIIICDIQLPKLDGFDIIKTLKNDANFKSTPIIAVTAFSMVGDRERILTAGFDGYISKPIDPMIFHDQIRSYIK